MGPSVSSNAEKYFISGEVIDNLRAIHQKASDKRIDYARAGMLTEAQDHEWFRDHLARIIGMIEAEQDLGIVPDESEPEPARENPKVKKNRKELR